MCELGHKGIWVQSQPRLWVLATRKKEPKRIPCRGKSPQCPRRATVACWKLKEVSFRVNDRHMALCLKEQKWVWRGRGVRARGVTGFTNVLLQNLNGASKGRMADQTWGAVVWVFFLYEQERNERDWDQSRHYALFAFSSIFLVTLISFENHLCRWKYSSVIEHLHDLDEALDSLQPLQKTTNELKLNVITPIVKGAKFMKVQEWPEDMWEACTLPMTKETYI